MRLFAAGVATLALGAAGIGCGGGGGGGGSAPPPGGGGGGGGGGTTVSVLQATYNAGAQVQSTSQFQGLYGDVLVTGVSLNGQQVTGDLNYSPWQAVGASSGQVQTGSSVAWSVAGSGSGGSLSFQAR